MSRAAPQVDVRRSARRKRTATAYREKDTIVVLLPHNLSATDERRYVDDLVKKVLAHEARTGAGRTDAHLATRAAELTARYLTPRTSLVHELTRVVWVTNQAHRWGSCTPATGVIRLSHRLQAMPAYVVDYVLLHELAHLVEPSHSARFHALVDVFPEAARAKGFLEGYDAGQGSSEVGDLDAAEDVD